MILQVRIPPHLVEDSDFLEKTIRKNSKGQKFTTYKIRRKSIDARGSKPVVVLAVELDPKPEPPGITTYQNVANAPEVLIIGSGPAGYFAALESIKLGMRPVVLERGKDAQTRRRDLRGLQQHGIVHPHSNYCFGEGGAGTYSDGKLYTRSVKRGNIQGILETLVYHGASEDILVDAHPHIGSNKLPRIIQNIRTTIEDSGGEVLFDHHVTDIHVGKKGVEAVIINGEKKRSAERIILATGHSARDIFALFESRSWTLEYKPFAIGVRIEHSQKLVDEIQYGRRGRTEGLPAASYGLTCQTDGRGVFSFCMCPGGLIVPASTAPGELVVNGMSLSRRDSPFANAGTVVEVREEDLQPYMDKGEMRGVFLQAALEKRIWKHGDGSQRAPAQRLTDFIDGRVSSTLPNSSYIPGIYSAPMHELLPSWIADRLRSAVRVFDRKMKGYITKEAVVAGLESRTSSPIRIPREEDGHHPDIAGLFPCGEGAGFAGGILSAAMDGERVARWVHDYINSKN